MAGLDQCSRPRIVRSVSRFARMLVLLLVAAWLPVTLHCRLEAAGLHGADECCASEQTAQTTGDCKDDTCPTVEEALYKETSQGLRLATPALVECFTGFAPLFRPLVLSIEPALSPERHAPPLELKAAWQFVTRAAPPARAPSLNA